MMTNVKHYLDDGANWQAQAVLACLRGYAIHCLHKDGDNEPSITVGRYENCREQGYVFTFKIDTILPVISYCVYEHRNSDCLCVQIFYCQGVDTPNASTVFYGKRDKWDIDKEFKEGEVFECATFIFEDINRRWKKFIDDKRELGFDEALKILRDDIQKFRDEAKAREEEYNK